MAEGWIKLNRQIQDHWIWKGEPFDKARAWIDLLMLANYEEKKTACKGRIVVCERGTVNMSVKSLADRWGWSRDKATRFLRLLESDEMIVLNATKNRTTITIVNYSKFQIQPTTDNATDKASNRQRADITKKDKKDKNIINAQNRFNQFEQTEYDFDELERILQK